MKTYGQGKTDDAACVATSHGAVRAVGVMRLRSQELPSCLPKDQRELRNEESAVTEREKARRIRIYRHMALTAGRINFAKANNWHYQPDEAAIDRELRRLQGRRDRFLKYKKARAASHDEGEENEEGEE